MLCLFSKRRQSWSRRLQSHRPTARSLKVFILFLEIFAKRLTLNWLGKSLSGGLWQYWGGHRH